MRQAQEIGSWACHEVAFTDNQQPQRRSPTPCGSKGSQMMPEDAMRRKADPDRAERCAADGAPFPLVTEIDCAVPLPVPARPDDRHPDPLLNLLGRLKNVKAA